MKNIQHVETVTSHCKQFERPITSQLQVNYLQRLCRALGFTFKVILYSSATNINLYMGYMYEVN